MLSDFNSIANTLAKALKKNSLKLTIAESLTGGLASKIMTDLPGSSAWFDSGFVTYSNKSKQKILDVKPNIIKKFGVVSENIAKKMALGALKHSDANISIGITGVAGPRKGICKKPVGTVCFAWAGKNSKPKTSTQYFKGDRNSIREQSVYFALQELLKYITI